MAQQEKELFARADGFKQNDRLAGNYRDVLREIVVNFSNN
jgi:hypothetical protein